MKHGRTKKLRLKRGQESHRRKGLDFLCLKPWVWGKGRREDISIP